MRRARRFRGVATLLAVGFLLAAATATLAFDGHLGSPAASPGSSGTAGVDPSHAAGEPSGAATAASPRPGGGGEDVDREDDADGHDTDEAGGDHDVDVDHDADDADADQDVKAVSEGSCGPAGTWRAEVEKDDGSIELELTVHGTAAHGSWLVEISQSGSPFYSAEATADESGEVEIEAERPYGTGAQTFTFSARERSTDGTCTGSVSI